jgi:hypothetical protein
MPNSNITENHPVTSVYGVGLSNFFYIGVGGPAGAGGLGGGGKVAGEVFILNTFCAEVGRRKPGRGRRVGVGRPPEMRMAWLLGRAIRCIVCCYFLPASVAISATGMSATAMTTESAPLSAGMAVEPAAAGISVASKSAAIGIAGVEVTVTGVSVIGISRVGISMIDVSTIGISAAVGIAAAIGISASVVFALKATSVKATTIEISSIPSLEKRPIVGIVGVIPIVTVPDGVVVVRIPGELSRKGYTVAVGIPIIGVGISALICRIGLLIYRSGSLVNAGWGWYLGIAPGGDEYAGSCQGGECKDLFHFV